MSRNRAQKSLSPLDALALWLATRASYSGLLWIALPPFFIITIPRLVEFLGRFYFTRIYVLRSLSAAIGPALLVAVACVLLIVCSVIASAAVRAFNGQPSPSSAGAKAGRFGFRREPWVTRAAWASAVVILLAAILGAALNVGLTLYAASVYDARLAEARAKFYAAPGCFELSGPGREGLLYCRGAGGLEVRVPLRKVPEQSQQAYRILEDREFGIRGSSANLRGFAAGLYRLFLGNGRQGGSGFPDQLAGMMLNLNPRSKHSTFDQLVVKFNKTLAGMRVSDMYDDAQIMSMYADMTDYGTVAGYNVRGLAAAARVYHNKAPEELTPAESQGLAALVQNSYTHFPYRRRDEDEAHFGARMNARKDRLRVTLLDAAADGEISKEAAEQTIAGLYTSLRPFEEVRAAVVLPRRDVTLNEVATLVPGASARFLKVETAADPAAQQILTDAAAQARAAVAGRLQPYEVDDLVVDAVVLGADGGTLAEVGLSRHADDGCSIYKPFLYAMALETGALSGIEATVLPGLSARAALARSNNDAVKRLIHVVGPERFKERLENNGFYVKCDDCESTALGAGVDGSPAGVAAAFRQFGYRDAGFRHLGAGVVTRVTDGMTGEVLFARTLVPASRPEAAAAVRLGLEDAAAHGTAKKLKELAEAAPLAAKTGTSAHFKNGRWIGGAGSWTVASDSRTGVTIAVRMRLRGRRPFRPEGGESAVLVVRDFIAKWRERYGR